MVGGSVVRRALYFVVYVVVFLPGLARAQAPTNPPNQTNNNAALGKLLDQYATIAGGWYLEQKCNTLAPNLKKEFEWNVGQTNIAMQRVASPAFLLQIQASAKQTAGKYACDQEAIKIIVATVSMSRDTTYSLTGQRYSAQSQLAYDGDRIAMLLRAQKVDDQCKLMPGDIRKEFDQRIETIIAHFEQSAGAGAGKQLRTRATANLPASPCDSPVKNALLGALAEARQMSNK